MIKKLKTKKNEGFTLVEIIVVLVILAVLAAVAIPTMVGFVQDSKVKAYISEARALYTAAQTKATELYTSGTATDSDDIEKALMNNAAAPLDLTVTTTAIGKLMDGSVTTTASPYFQAVTVGAKGKVESVVYRVTVSGTKYDITVTAGKSAEISEAN